MARIPSSVTTGQKAKRGAAVANAGTATSSASSKPTKGNSPATRVMGSGQPGAPVALDIAPAVGGANPPLAGHKQVDPTQVRGPVRPWAGAEHPGGGKKTPSAREMIEKGLD